MKIGEVLDLLHDEFPQLTVTKVRFLEHEGLIKPSRRPSGFRDFSDKDVDRLRAILRLQRSGYLPLHVIRKHLDGKTAAMCPCCRRPLDLESQD